MSHGVRDGHRLDPSRSSRDLESPIWARVVRGCDVLAFTRQIRLGFGATLEPDD